MPTYLTVSSSSGGGISLRIGPPPTTLSNLTRTLLTLGLVHREGYPHMDSFEITTGLCVAHPWITLMVRLHPIERTVDNGEACYPPPILMCTTASQS